MGKNKNTATVEATETKQPNVTVSESGKRLGRPADPNSKRQQMLKEREAKKINGIYVPLGRPVVPGSKRQLHLAELAEKKANGVAAKRGRPKMTEEQKAQAKAEREALKAKAIAAGQI